MAGAYPLDGLLANVNQERRPHQIAVLRLDPERSPKVRTVALFGEHPAGQLSLLDEGSLGAWNPGRNRLSH